MKDINTLALSGRLTRDPELRALQSGQSVCDLGMAVNESYKQGDEWKERGMFFDVTVWGGLGENCAQHLVKGQQVFISGRLQQRSWEDDSGNRRSKVSVTAEQVLFGAKPGERSEGPSRQVIDPSRRAQDDFRDVDFGGDDIPF